MKFNPTDKSDSIIGDIDFLLFGDSSTLNTDYSLTDRTRNVNIALDEIVADLYRADPNYLWDDTTNTDFPFATVAITSGLDHYSLIDSTAVIWSVRMKDASGHFKTLTPRLRSEFSSEELESTGTPESYYKMGSAIFPVPIPNYSYASGVELAFQRGANHFTTSSTDAEPGFNPQFHQYLSVSASLRYAVSHGMTKKVRELRGEKALIQQAVAIHYQRRSPDDRVRLHIKRFPSKYGLSGGLR